MIKSKLKTKYEEVSSPIISAFPLKAIFDPLRFRNFTNRESKLGNISAVKKLSCYNKVASKGSYLISSKAKK